MTRRPLVGGNWKMHFVGGDVARYCEKLLEDGGSYAAEVVFFPSAPLLSRLARGLEATTFSCGGQDIHPAEKGAHTGDVSGAQLVDAGCSWALCGHSERRKDHCETDAQIGAKATAARRHGLIPMICIGETASERDAGATFEVLDRQLEAALADRPDPFAIAYEPVWAIGTGATATPEIAQETHAHIRETLSDLVGSESASTKRILYGGSVNPENAAALIALPDLDGFLVGGASLDPERFLAIIRSCG